jgi:AbrB family looped-hinge helix DNA binding protein
MPVEEVTLSSKHQIVVPRQARRALGLKPGDKLVIVSLGEDVVLLKRPRSYTMSTKGAARGLYPEAYLEAERGDWDREKAR